MVESTLLTVLVVLGSILVAIAAVFVFKRVRKRFRKKTVRVCGKDYPRDKIILHCPFTAGKFVPSQSHFVMKLETFLRATNIPYEIGTGLKPRDAPKNKVPWIEYNGMTMGDSQLIIQFLNKEFSIDLNKNLDKQQRATAWAIQKWIEEFTYWLNVGTRWSIFNEDYLTPKFVNDFMCQKHVKYVVNGLTKKTLYAVGVGRHTDEEVHEMMVFDLKQFSAILGDKKYLMGDSITDVDCSAFGMLCQVRYQTPEKSPATVLLNNSDEMKNVRDYMDRIKSLYWSDWDERLLK